jgi:hypothetical protein
MDLTSFIGNNSDINVIDIYIGNSKKVGYKDISFRNELRNPKTIISLIEYHNNDIVYNYDLTSDNQKVVKRIFKKDKEIPKYYMLGYQEHILPTHRFPCTNDIFIKTQIKRTMYRINNRMYITLDEEDDFKYLYIRFSYNDNIDMKKMQSDFDRAIEFINKNIILLDA